MSQRERAWCGLAAVLLMACTPPGAQRIVGPDGSPMSHVHCGSDQGQCFRIAGELCPGGYDIQPVLSSSDGNFLVRCRAERLLRSAPVSAPPPAAPPTFAGSAPPYTASGAPAPAAPRPLTNQPGSAEIDLGY